MFTLLPSIYIIAAQYFRRWNPSCYDEETNEEEKHTFDSKDLHITDAPPTSNTTQHTETTEEYYNTLLQCTDETFTDNNQLIARSHESKTNNHLSNVIDDDDDDDIHSNTSKPTIIKPNRSTSLLNIERRNKTYTNGLDDDDIAYLMNETEFTRKQIQDWYSDFLRDCPDGKLSKSKFIDIYKQFYRKGQVAKFCEHAFRVFDKDGSGSIDFVEFLIAVNMTSTKDPEKKTALFFSMYDIDQNGFIDRSEMRCVVESIYELLGINIQDPTRIDAKVQEIFYKAECDQTGYLTRDQFTLACKNDQHIRKLLVPKTKAPNHH